jgi:hypothetical protein
VNLADSAPLDFSQAVRDRGRFVLLIAWLLALALIALQVQSLAVATLRDGVLFDNDDAMRLVQLRAWMHGQGWTDLTQYRVNPPDSPIAHWSRVVELPLAGLILLLRLGADPTTAERIAAVLWPSLLLAAFVLGLLALARRLVGAPTLLAGAVIVAFNPVLLFQFVPGRIDHHGAQLLLMLALAGLTGRALFRGCWRAAVAAGMVCALTLAIGLATVPLVATVAAAFAVTWIAEGASRRRPVAAFGASLAVATLVAFLLTVPPERWLLPTVDSLSLPWLWLALGGGALLVALAGLLSPQAWQRRAVYAISGGALVCAVFAIVWPACLAGPYASVDPLVKDLWLSGVGEAQPLPLLVLHDPPQFLFFLAFPLIGWLGLALAAAREGRREPGFVLLFGLTTVALGVALDQMRGAPLAAMFGLFGWLYLIDRAMAAGSRRIGSFAGMAGVVTAALVFAAALPFGWDALAAAISPPASGKDAPSASASCRNPSDMAALADQPPGIVLAPLRLGPRILVATPHSVLGAPYHRNNDGNRIALAALSSDPATARQIIEDRHVDYVALCLGDQDLDRLGSRSSDALVNRLAADRAPAWLSPLPQVGPIRTWRVVGASQAD